MDYVSSVRMATRTAEDLLETIVKIWNSAMEACDADAFDRHQSLRYLLYEKIATVRNILDSGGMMRPLEELAALLRIVKADDDCLAATNTFGRVGAAEARALDDTLAAALSSRQRLDCRYIQCRR